MSTNDPGQYPPNPHGQQPPPWAGQAAYGQPAPPPKRSWFARHKVLTAVLGIVGLLIVLSGIGAAVGGGGDPKAAPAASRSADAGAAGRGTPGSLATTAAAPKATAAPKSEPPAQPDLTTSQEQAVGAAKDYLDTSAFSRLGLIEQLSSKYGSGFPKADATFAVDYLKVNWKEQAVRAAKEYLETNHFSRAGLIQQLSSAYGSKFTRAEATYAADQVGL